MTLLRSFVPVVLAISALHSPSARAITATAPDFAGRWQLDVVTRRPQLRLEGRAFTSLVRVDISSPSHPIGRAVVEGVLDVDGRMVDLEVAASLTTRGFPTVLHRAALQEVFRRRRTPVQLDGAAVPTLLSVTAVFRDDPRREPEGPLEPVTHELEIAQDAATVTSVRHTVMGRQVTIYRLDGSRGRTRLMLSHPAAPLWEHTSRWDEDMLITASVPKSRRTIRSEVLRREGDALIVETSWTGPENPESLSRMQAYKRMSAVGARADQR